METIAHNLTEIQECTLVTEKVLATLIQQYLHKGHQLFIDSYYTSMSLNQYFIESGTYVTRSIRHNIKSSPTQSREVSLSRGGVAYYNHGNIVVEK